MRKRKAIPQRKYFVENGKLVLKEKVTTDKKWSPIKGQKIEEEWKEVREEVKEGWNK